MYVPCERGHTGGHAITHPSQVFNCSARERDLRLNSFELTNELQGLRHGEH